MLNLGWRVRDSWSPYWNFSLCNNDEIINVLLKITQREAQEYQYSVNVSATTITITIAGMLYTNKASQIGCPHLYIHIWRHFLH